MVVLRINEIEYGPATDFLDGSGTYDLTPGAVLPVIDIIKNDERSLDGTMNVDVVARKFKLDIVFPMLENREFKKLLSIFSPAADSDIVGIYKIEYYITNTMAEIENADRDWYFDTLEYTPFVIGDGIRWQNVRLSFREI